MGEKTLRNVPHLPYQAKEEGKETNGAFQTSPGRRNARKAERSVPRRLPSRRNERGGGKKEAKRRKGEKLQRSDVTEARPVRLAGCVTLHAAYQHDCAL